VRDADVRIESICCDIANRPSLLRRPRSLPNGHVCHLSIFMTTIMYNPESGGVAGTHGRGPASKGGGGRM